MAEQKNMTRGSNPEVELIVTDLDGTMFYEKNLLTPQNHAAVTRAIQRGCKYVVSTGRCRNIIPMEVLPETDYIISCNGSLIVEGKTDRKLFSSYISRENAALALKLIRGYHPFLEFFVEDDMMLEQETLKCLDRYHVPAFHMTYIQAGRATIVPSFEQFLQTDGNRITKINMPDGKSVVLDRLREELAELGLFSLDSNRKGIEITNWDVNKGNSLRTLCDTLRIPLEKVAAFGDSYNDVSMLRIAGYGVAMGNAEKRVKDAASYVTRSNKENGVAYFLERELGI